jgi:thioesterase domain-containing protein/aryl carrier-like protein
MLHDPDQTPATGPDVVATFPCSTMQRQMWFLDQLTPGDPAQNVAMRWELTGRFQTASIERAFQAVIDRHEILRTRFVERDGDPVQEVVARFDIRPSHVDLRTTPAAERPLRIEEIAAVEAARSFDLSAPGLIRVVIVRAAGDHVTLLVVVHHIIFDGFSIGLMASEVGRAIEAFEAGRAPDFAPLPLQYGDYTLWQQDYLASGALDEDRAYWTDAMRGVPYFEIEPDKPRPPVRTATIARLHRDLGADFGDQLATASKSTGTSPFTFGAALVSGSLHRVTGAAEVVLSTPVSERSEPDLEALIGPFITNQILRLPTAATTAFVDHVARTRGVVEGALTHRNLPFSTLVEIVNPPRDLSRAPIAAVAFSLMPIFTKPHRYDGFAFASSPMYNPGSAQDMRILILGRPGGWRLTIEFSPDLYEQRTIEGLMTTIGAGFERVFQSTALTLADLPLSVGLAARGGTETRALKRIEQVLLAHPDVAAAAAVQTTGAPYAFVSPKPDSLTALETLPATLMARTAADLAADERPRGISVLASLPRTASGDIDRARLPMPPQPLATVLPAPRVAAPLSVAEIANRLAALWADLLARPAPARDRSFFDQGGHSLLAVRLMARIRQGFGVTLGVRTLYEHPTIDALAHLIATALRPEVPAAEDDWRVEPLQTEGTAQPIIAVNDVAIMVSALGHMAEKHPATCVRLFDGTRGIDQTERTFEDIAAEYAKVVRKVQPQGPYVIFGVCVHGNIALETARHLQAEGETITAVILKDVWEPGYVARLKSSSRHRWLERLYAFRNKVRMVHEGTLTVAAMLGSYRILRKSGLLHLLKAIGLIDKVRATDLEPEQERFVAYISRARNHYRPKPFNAPVLHVITRITPRGRAFAPSIGWEDVVTGPLKTLYIDDIRVHRGLEFGTAELGREIDTFLAEQAARAAQ